MFFFRLGFFFFCLLPSSLRAAHPGPPPLPIPPAAGEGPRAVATFACIGLYWAPAQGAQDNACHVAYRPAGTEAWQEALPLWFDSRNHEYRGSIVNLKAGTSYEVRLSLEKTGAQVALNGATWKEEFPIARTIMLPTGAIDRTLEIKDGGTPEGYVLYTASPDDPGVIDVAGKSPYCVDVKASYVIIRGLTLRGAGQHGVNLSGPVHDVVVEGCDISGWGRIDSDGFGENFDAGISGINPEVARIVIQGNKIHHPRSNSNDWMQARSTSGQKVTNHPDGPQAIVFKNCAGNNVIRYNEIFSDELHRFNDGMGGGDNFSFKGFPGADSDIYGNILRNTIDDALEIEGGGCNVRIWDNLMEEVFTGVAAASCSIGPLYVFRNILGRTRAHNGPADEPSNNGVFGKLGDNYGYGGGRLYFFHNTILQPSGTSPGMRTLGANCALADWGGPMTNVVSRNNIWVITPDLQQVYLAFRGNHKTNPNSINDRFKSPTNDLDYDLINGEILATPEAEPHAVHGMPVYALGSDADAPALDPSSPGYDAGIRLPNFNDDFQGAKPDIGAVEANGERPVFGVQSPWKNEQGLASEAKASPEPLRGRRRAAAP